MLKVFFRAILCLGLWSAPLAAQERLWVFECEDHRCHKEYSRILFQYQGELNEAYGWIESLGYSNALLADAGGPPWNDSSALVTGPRLNLLKQANFDKIARGSGAFYYEGTQDISFPLGHELEALTLEASALDDVSITGSVDEILENIRATQTHRSYLFAHELFHAFQAPNRAGFDTSRHAWIIEGSAVAIGEAWRATHFGVSRRRDMKFDEPLNISTNPEFYERGFFFDELSHEVSDSPRMSFLTGFFKPSSAISEYGLQTLSDHIQAGYGINLYNAYNNIVARETNSEGMFNNVEPNLVAALRNAGPSPISKTLPALTVMARPLIVAAEALVPPPAPRDGVKTLALVTMEVPEGSAPDHIGFFVETEWLRPDRRKHMVFDLTGEKVEFLSRVSNMQETDVDKTKPETVTVQIGVETFEVSVPTCVAAGERAQIKIEGLRDDVALAFRADRGSVTFDGQYTAPAAGPDKLYVNAFVSKDRAEFVEIGEIEVLADTCPFVFISADGFRFTFDPQTETTLAEDPSGGSKVYFDRSFIYANEPSMGGWIKLPKGIMARFGFDMMGNMGSALAYLTDPGFDLNFDQLDEDLAQLAFASRDPFEWGRAPYDFLEVLEYSFLARIASQVPGIEISQNDSCPALSPRCSIITINDADRVVYNQSGQIIELRLRDGNTHRVERADTSIVAPANAKPMNF